MTIPQNDQFEAIFSTLTLNEPSGVGSAFEALTVIPATPPYLRDSKARDYTEVRLWMRTDAGLSADASLKKVESELRTLGHPASREIASAALAVFALTRKSSSPAVSQFRGLLAGAQSTDVNQWFIVPATAPPMPRRRLGPFQIGPLDAETMSYRMKKADCDYFERDGARLQGRFTIERDPFPATILPFVEACANAPGSFQPNNSLGYIVLDHYFHSVADFLFDEFFRVFEDAQSLRVAIGFGYANITQMQLLFGVERVSLFSRVRHDRRGWGCPTRSRPITDVSALDRALPESSHFLARFGIGAFGPSALDSTTHSFARFLTNAVRHLCSDDRAEAFLYHIIALDLLLGEQDASTRTVATRTAVLVYKPLAQPYEHQRRSVERLYDARSKFVHEGQTPQDGYLEEATEITRQVMYCLLRLNKSPSNHTPDFMKQWLKELDLVKATLEAGRTPDSEDFTRCGIELSEKDRERPRFDFRNLAPN